MPDRAEPFVAALKEAGIIQGKSNNQFSSQQNITRGEAALMLAEAYKIGSSTQDNVKFTDVPERYWEAVNVLLANGITTGKTATTFGTSDDIARGEFAIFLCRISEFQANDDGTGSGVVDDDTGGDPVTLTDLQDLINSTANYVENYYTEETWQNLEGALQTANDVMNNTDAAQTEIDQAAEGLTSAIEGLILETISYTTGPDETANGVMLTFTDSVGEDGAIDPVEGTIADAEVTLSTDGTTLTLQTEAGAEADEAAEFDLNVDGTEVEVNLTWDGTGWDVETVPANVIEEITAGESDMDGVINLELLNDGLVDGSISIDELLENPKLLRLNILEGSGLAEEDVISIRNGEFDVLTVTLGQEDIDRGFIDLGLETGIIRSLAGDGPVDLTAIIDRGEGDTATGTIGTIELPELPLVEPVVDLVGSTVEDLLYILSGDQPLRVSLEANALQEDIEAGSTLELTINGAQEETITHVITQAEIDQGFINYTFEDEALINRLLSGLTVGKQYYYYARNHIWRPSINR